MTVKQGFGDEARICITYTISAASRWDRKRKNLSTNIEKCKQRLKNVNNKLSEINDLVLLWLWAVCTLFAYLYFEFPIERVKFLEYKSPIIRWPIFVSPNPCYTITDSLCIFLRRTDRNDHVIIIIQLSCLNDDGTSITIRVYRVCLQFIHACYYNNKMRKYQQSTIFNL